MPAAPLLPLPPAAQQQHINSRNPLQVTPAEPLLPLPPAAQQQQKHKPDVAAQEREAGALIYHEIIELKHGTQEGELTAMGAGLYAILLDMGGDGASDCRKLPFATLDRKDLIHLLIALLAKACGSSKLFSSVAELFDALTKIDPSAAQEWLRRLLEGESGLSSKPCPLHSILTCHQSPPIHRAGYALCRKCPSEGQTGHRCSSLLCRQASLERRELAGYDLPC